MNQFDSVIRIIDNFAEKQPGRSVSVKLFKGGNFEYSVRGNAPRPAASVIKMALAVALYDMSYSGMINLDNTVAKKMLPKTKYPNVFAAFDSEHNFSLKELIALSLITSDNPTSEYLLKMVGIPRINETLMRMGCSEYATMTVGFSDPMLSREGRKNILTSDDALKIIEEITYNSRYLPIRRALENNLRNQRIPLLIPDGVVIIHKTGTLAGVVNDVGIIVDDGLELGISVMTDKETSPEITSLEIGRLAYALWKEMSREG